MAVNRVRVLLMIGSMHGGGSERQTLLLLENLDRSHFEIHLYVKRAEGSLLRRIPDDVRIHVATDFGTRNLWYWPGRVRGQEIEELAALLEEHQIDVLYDRTYHMTLVAGPACLQTGTPHISTIVSPPHRAVPAVESRFVRLKRRQLAQAYRLADGVIAVSQATANSAAQYYGIRRESITVIENPVEPPRPDRDRQTPAVDQHAEPTAERPRKLVCVARMTAEKGHRVLLDAIATYRDRWPDQIDDLQFCLLGDGPLRPDLETYAKRLGILEDRRVVFAGHVDEPRDSIREADALVLPSSFEGMPNVLLEALVAETPVIATRTGGAVGIEKDAPIAFWAEPDDPVSLAQAIRRYVTEPAKAATHVTNGSHTIRMHHDLHTAIERISDMLIAAHQRVVTPST